MRNVPHNWTPEQIARLRELWGTAPLKAIAHQLGLTLKQVNGKATRLLLPRVRGANVPRTPAPRYEGKPVAAPRPPRLVHAAVTEPPFIRPPTRAQLMGRFAWIPRETGSRENG